MSVNRPPLKSQKLFGLSLYSSVFSPVCTLGRVKTCNFWQALAFKMAATCLQSGRHLPSNFWQALAFKLAGTCLQTGNLTLIIMGLKLTLSWVLRAKTGWNHWNKGLTQIVSVILGGVRWLTFFISLSRFRVTGNFVLHDRRGLRVAPHWLMLSRLAPKTIWRQSLGRTTSSFLI